jgi:hypothetical protein
MYSYFNEKEDKSLIKVNVKKLLLIPIIFASLILLFSVGVSAAEGFSAENIVLSASSQKSIEYHVTANASSTTWAVNFSVEYDEDIFILNSVVADSRFSLAYTESNGKCTVLLYSKTAQNVTVAKGSSIVTFKFTVSDKTQPGMYSIGFKPASSSMVTYSGAIKDMYVDGGTLFDGNKVTYINNGKVVSSEFSAAGDTIHPFDTESTNPDEIFIGWYSPKDKSHDKIFTAPGESFVLGNYDVTLEAIYLEVKTLRGASVYFPNENNDVRLRYISAVNKKQYDFLFKEICGGESSSLILGTLICPTFYAQGNAGESSNGGMDFDALSSDRNAVQTSVPMAPGGWLDAYTVGTIGGSGSYYYYEGILSNILRETTTEDGRIINCDTEFSAVAYITITYPSGKTVNHFARYSPEDHSRSVRYVVEAAINDTSRKETDYYRFKIDGVYRPYSPSQMAALYRIKAGM